MEYERTKDEIFDEIYRTYQKDVYKISLYFTKDTYIAEDIAQKSFIKLYLHFEDVNLDCVRAYLFRTARNLSYNWLRDSQKEWRGEYLENIPEENVPQYSVEDQYIHREEQDRKREFIGKIMEELYEENESWYDILHLIYGLEKSHEQVAEELRITRDVLYSKLYRAKRWIRKKFENEYENF